MKLEPLFSELDALVRDQTIADGLALDTAVRGISSALFGSGDCTVDETFTAEQKTIYRVAKRLVKYTRRLYLEAKAARTKTTTSSMQDDTSVSAVWTTVARNTDQLMHVAEHFQVSLTLNPKP